MSLTSRLTMTMLALATTTFLGIPSQGQAETAQKTRDQLPAQHKWNLSEIFASWDDWQKAYDKLDKGVADVKALKGTLKQGPDQLLKAFKLDDEWNILFYRVYRYPTLAFDLDQRDNSLQGKVQLVYSLEARYGEAISWMSPELLSIPLETVRGWMAANKELATYRYAIERLYRQQEHVLNEEGERLLSLGDRLGSSPAEIYSAASTADMRYNQVTLSSGEEVLLSPGRYQAILQTNRSQADRAKAFQAYYEVWQKQQNTWGAIYNGVLQRDWFLARARGYTTTLDSALFGNNIPTAVYENLIATVKGGVAPLQRYHKLRKQALGLSEYHLYDSSINLVDLDKRYDYDQVTQAIVDSVSPLGKAYQERVRKGFAGGWVDVHETPGKRSGAYSAGVYGVHPYMLVNFNETLNEVFTVAHEMGHTMHTMLAQDTQPFSYSSPTLFVAEVASTMNEALFLDQMLARTKDPKERVMLLQHAIDGITSTFYTQVLFADFELQAHKLVEKDEPVTADELTALYAGLLKQYYGDAVTVDPQYGYTWTRIPHFYRTPYYVYQYATCFASSAKLHKAITSGSSKEKAAAVDRYLTLLKSGSSDYPMELLKKSGVDLSQKETVQAVVDELDRLVTQLEKELAALKK